MPRVAQRSIAKKRKKPSSYNAARRRISVPVAKQPRVPKHAGFFEPLGSTLGGLAGSVIGGPAGAALGSSLGSTAGSLISKLTGFGSYKVRKNTIFADSIPQFENRMGDGSIRIRHKEFINDVISSSTAGAFLPIQYAVSASDANTFPYLSQLAVNFEEFAFEGLVFEYITSSGSISSTGQLGTVVGAMQFNSLAVPYTNKQQMEASTFGQSTVASQSCIFPIECDALQTPSNGIFYTARPGIVSANNDKRWSQLGNFTLATVGMPNASETVGELYVTYDCLLMKPILIQDSGAQADHWTSASGIVVANGGPYFGTNPQLTSGSDNFTALGGAVILINPAFNGILAVSYGVHGATGATQVDPVFAAGVNASVYNILDGGVTYQFAKTSDVAGLAIWVTAYFQIVSNGTAESTITVSGGSFTAPETMDLIITQLPADFN